MARPIRKKAKKAVKASTTKKSPVKAKKTAAAKKKSASSKKTVKKSTVWDKLATKKKTPKKKPVVKKAPVKKASPRKTKVSRSKKSYRVKLIKKSATSPAVEREIQTVASEQLPENYGDNMIHVLVRDPEYIYAFWEIQKEHAEGNLAQLGGSWHEVESVLRVYNVSEEDGESYFDIPLRHFENNYFINVSPNTSYVVEIGLLHQDGRYIALAVSNKVTTPRNEASDILDEKWMAINFEQIYAASGGLDIGLSSLSLKQLMELRLRAGLSSQGSQQAKAPKSRQSDKKVPPITQNLK